MKRVLFATLLSGALLVPGMFAREGRIRRREENQQKRIAEGIKTGQLNPREAARIEGQEARLNGEVRHDRKTGGGLSPRERAKIERQQDRLSKEIYREKHDKK